jgi:hypothetical protein
MKNPSRVIEILSAAVLIVAGALGLSHPLLHSFLHFESFVDPQLLVLTLASLLAIGLGLERWASLDIVLSRIEERFSPLLSKVGIIPKCRTVSGYEASFKATEPWISRLEDDIITFAVMETGAAPEAWIQQLLKRMKEVRNTPNAKAVSYKVWIIGDAKEDEQEARELLQKRVPLYRKFGVENDITWRLARSAPPFTFDITIFDRKHISMRFLAEPRNPEQHVSLLIENDPDLARTLRDSYLGRLGQGEDLRAPSNGVRHSV